MAPSPEGLFGQIAGIAGAVMDTRAIVADNILHRPQPGAQDWDATRETFRDDHGKVLVPFAGKSKEASLVHQRERLGPWQLSQEAYRPKTSALGFMPQ